MGEAPSSGQRALVWVVAVLVLISALAAPRVMRLVHARQRPIQEYLDQPFTTAIRPFADGSRFETTITRGHSWNQDSGNSSYLVIDIATCRLAFDQWSGTDQDAAAIAAIGDRQVEASPRRFRVEGRTVQIAGTTLTVDGVSADLAHDATVILLHRSGAPTVESRRPLPGHAQP